MANVIHSKIYREMFMDVFQERARTNTVASMISKMHEGQYATSINNPYRDVAVTVSGSTTAIDPCAVAAGSMLCELDINDFTTFNETIFVNDYISTTEKVCETNEEYTNVDLMAASLKEQTQAMIEAVDRYVLTEADAQATLTLPAIIDAATAKAAMEGVTGLLSGFSGGFRDRFVVIGNSLYPFFVDLVSNVQTPFGDAALETGDVFNYMGIDILVVRDAQMPSAARALAGIKGSIDTYMDPVVRSGEKDAIPSVPTKVSLEKVRYQLVYLQTKIWALNLDKVIRIG